MEGQSLFANIFSLSWSLKSVRVHFAPGSNGRSFPLEYSLKFHLNCMVAAPGMLLSAGKKLEGACAARAVPTCAIHAPLLPTCQSG